MLDLEDLNERWKKDLTAGIIKIAVEKNLQLLRGH
jgi:hypothetical protein